MNKNNACKHMKIVHSELKFYEVYKKFSHIIPMQDIYCIVATYLTQEYCSAIYNPCKGNMKQYDTKNMSPHLA